MCANYIQMLLTQKSPTYFAHRRCSIFNLQQQCHDLSLFSLLRRQAFFVNVDEQFVEVLHVVRFHRRKVALRLKVNNLGLAVRRLHVESSRRACQWRRRGR